MLGSTNIILLISLSTFVLCDPYDDGKYRPTKNGGNDDGRYYRPLNEGKYVPSDEGKYTYIYRQDDDGIYKYIHQLGPEGGVGGNGGKGGFGGKGGNGPNGPNGPDGPNGPNGPNSRNKYAGRYPYIHSIINELVDKYVSTDYIHGEGSINHYKKVYADNEVAVKCRYLTPHNNDTEFTTQYPPRVQVKEGENLGSYYSFKGTKVLNTVSNALVNKMKLQYEVFVRVVDEVSQ